MTYPAWLPIALTALVGASGWAKVIYDYMAGKPRIVGRFLGVIEGQMPDPGAHGKYLTSYVVYLYLTNRRKSPVHILEYEMEIDRGRGFEKVKRVYGVLNIQRFHFLNKTRQEMEIPLVEKLIYREAKAIDFGTPLHGFVLFAGDASYYGTTVRSYRVTCTDAFGKKHRIDSKGKDLPNLYLLLDMAGIKLAPSTRKKEEAGDTP